MRTISTFACLGFLLVAALPATPAAAMPAAARVPIPEGTATKGTATKGTATKGTAHRAAAAARHPRHRVRHLARRHRSINYGWAPRIPRYDPVQVQREVHTWYPYRTPYAYPGLYGY